MIISIEMNSNFFKCKYTCNASKLSLGWKVWQRKVVADKKYASTTRKCGTKAQTKPKTKTKTQAPADREREKKVGGRWKSLVQTARESLPRPVGTAASALLALYRFLDHVLKHTYMCVPNKSQTGRGKQFPSASNQSVVDAGWLKSVCAAGFGMLFTQILLKSFPPTGNWQIDRHDCEHNGQVSHYWQNLFVGLNWLVVEWMARIIQLFKF